MSGPNTVAVTATVADLEAAIAAKTEKGERWHQPCECFMAKAISRVTGVASSCGLTYALVGYTAFTMPAGAIELISLFDQDEYEAVSALLPATFILEPRES